MSATDLVLLTQCLILGLQLWLLYRQLKVSEGSERRAQRHDRLSVRPYLQLPTIAIQGRLKIRLLNEGNGIAIITSFVLLVDGREMTVMKTPDRLTALKEALGLTAESFDPRYKPIIAWIDFPAALKPGGEIDMIDLPVRGTIDTSTLRDRISIRIRYKSLYDEEFECDANWPPPT